jgi:ATP-dependent DNA helicase RecG
LKARASSAPGESARGALAAKLARLGIRSRAELPFHLPLRYEDETVVFAPHEAPAGRPVLVQARVLRAEVARGPRRQLRVHAEALLLRFFHFYPGQLAAFRRAAERGLWVRAFGEVRRGFFGAEMVHPRFRILRADEPLAATLTPVYPSTAGLAQATLRRLVLEALDESDLEETLPEELLRRHRLPGIAQALGTLHRPPPDTDRAALADRTHPAWQRVKFDELLAQQLSLRLAYRARRERRALALGSRGPLLRRFLAGLPFRLTSAQRRAMAEILSDLDRPHPMQRLLQGDVGSGKTIVAAIACLAAVDAGAQAAVMAPTEILSEQHWRKFSAWLAPLGVRIAWLHGALGAAGRRAALAAIASGEAAIAIGTHALIEERARFARLALAVVDEQHRFGVRQRLALRKKGEAGAAEPLVPHQLMMSATPIPRTLAMTYYADLDVSLVDEMPPGRGQVATRLVSAGRRAEVLARIRASCAAGEQAYWVCPVIEGAGESDLRAALDTHARLRAELRGLEVGLVHGRLSAAEKAEVMGRFAAGAIQVLVATSVIEVGVDVPAATLMVIEHAERFGLAQLHQLRGRIGRGARDSVCILLYAGPLSAAARARLKVIYESRDGFEIAQRDLALRGPGEVLGERQSGVPLLRFADLVTDEPLVRAAHQAALWLLETDPAAAARHVERWLGSRGELARA